MSNKEIKEKLMAAYVRVKQKQPAYIRESSNPTLKELYEEAINTIPSLTIEKMHQVLLELVWEEKIFMAHVKSAAGMPPDEYKFVIEPVGKFVIDPEGNVIDKGEGRRFYFVKWREEELGTKMEEYPERGSPPSPSPYSWKRREKVEEEELGTKMEEYPERGSPPYSYTAFTISGAAVGTVKFFLEKTAQNAKIETPRIISYPVVLIGSYFASQWFKDQQREIIAGSITGIIGEEIVKWYANRK
jgi:hypothetical protein